METTAAAVRAQQGLNGLLRRSAATRADRLAAAQSSSAPALRSIWVLNGLLVALAAAGFALTVGDNTSPTTNVMVAALVALGIASSLHGRMSVHVGSRARWDLGWGEFPVGLALLLTGGWGLLVGLLAGSALGYRSQIKSPIKFVFNVANFTAAGAAALAVRHITPGEYLPAIAAVLAWCLLNHGCVQLVLRLAAGTKLRTGQGLRWEALGFNVLSGITGTATGLLLLSGSAGAVAAPLPLLVVWSFVRLRQQRSDVLRMRRALDAARRQHPGEGFTDIAMALDQALRDLLVDVSGDLVMQVGTQVRRFRLGDGIRSVAATAADLEQPWIVESKGRPAHLLPGTTGQVVMSLSASSTSQIALRIERTSGPLTRAYLPAIATAVTQASSWTAALDLDTVLSALRDDLQAGEGNDLQRHLMDLQDVRERLVQAAEAAGDVDLAATLRADLDRAERAVGGALAVLMNQGAQPLATVAPEMAWTTTGTTTATR